MVHGYNFFLLHWTVHCYTSGTTSDGLWLLEFSIRAWYLGLSRYNLAQNDLNPNSSHIHTMSRSLSTPAPPPLVMPMRAPPPVCPVGSLPRRPPQPHPRRPDAPTGRPHRSLRSLVGRASTPATRLHTPAPAGPRHHPPLDLQTPDAVRPHQRPLVF